MEKCLELRYIDSQYILIHYPQESRLHFPHWWRVAMEKPSTKIKMRSKDVGEGKKKMKKFKDSEAI